MECDIFDNNNHTINSPTKLKEQWTMYAYGFRAYEHSYESILLINTSIIGCLISNVKNQRIEIIPTLSEKLIVYGMFQMVCLE